MRLAASLILLLIMLAIPACGSIGAGNTLRRPQQRIDSRDPMMATRFLQQRR
jgi:hypothetical protein